MYVCAYSIWMYTCMSRHTCVHMCLHIYISVHMCMHECVRKHILHTNIYTCICTSVVSCEGFCSWGWGRVNTGDLLMAGFRAARSKNFPAELRKLLERTEQAVILERSLSTTWRRRSSRHSTNTGRPGFKQSYSTVSLKPQRHVF